MTGLNLESFLHLLRADLGAWALLGLVVCVIMAMVWTSWGSRRRCANAWYCLSPCIWGWRVREHVPVGAPGTPARWGRRAKATGANPSDPDRAVVGGGNGHNGTRGRETSGRHSAGNSVDALGSAPRALGAGRVARPAAAARGDRSRGAGSSRGAQGAGPGRVHRGGRVKVSCACGARAPARSGFGCGTSAVPNSGRAGEPAEVAAPVVVVRNTAESAPSRASTGATGSVPSVSPRPLHSLRPAGHCPRLTRWSHRTSRHYRPRRPALSGLRRFRARVEERLLPRVDTRRGGGPG